MTMELLNKRIVLGLTGGIACYKSAELTRLLKLAGAQVQVVMTQAATRFITPTTMQALSGQPVYTEDSNLSDQGNAMPHIGLARSSDAILVAPASANFLAKLTHGIADDLLSTLCLARTIPTPPLFVAPAMNQQMWLNPATQRNITQLREDGLIFLGPDAGSQACGETGEGRLLEPEILYEALFAHLHPKLLANKRVLITAGPTFEPIDPVRGLMNRSSGKMGFAIARAARASGAQVKIIAGPTHLPTPWDIERQNVITTQQMFEAVLANIQNVDIFISVAAVADWRIQNVQAEKIKKTPNTPPASLMLAENPDILAHVARLPNPPFCVGFAAESEALEAHAHAKRLHKNIPLLVGNLCPAAFGADDNELLLFDDQGTTLLPRASKQVLAHQLIEEIVHRAQKGSTSAFNTSFVAQKKYASLCPSS